MTSAARVDALMKAYAAECDRVYDDKTRGDYTFLGILSTLVREIVSPDEWDTLVALRNGTAKVVPNTDKPLADWERELLTGHKCPNFSVGVPPQCPECNKLTDLSR